MPYLLELLAEAPPGSSTMIVIADIRGCFRLSVPKLPAAEGGKQ